MGLNFHLCKSIDPQWSYGGFHRFRTHVAKSIGIQLDEMEGFTSNGKSWDSIDDPIKILLNHSDCDGELEASECEKIYPRLIEIVSSWPKTVDNEYDIETALKLAEAMKECVETDGWIEFC